MTAAKSKVEELYADWNNNLFQQYTKLFHEGEHTTIWDGVVSPTLYASSPLKIMFLNREGYTEEGNDYDVSDALFAAIGEEIRLFPDQRTMRSHLKHYLLVLRQLESGLLLNTSDEQMREIVSENTSDENWFNSQIARVAYCNVKKSDGLSKSNVKDLYSYAKKGIEILKEQIRFFNPTIILAGDVCSDILEDLVDWGDNLYFPEEEHKICIWQLKINGKCYPFVDMYHPSRTQGMSDYYLTLLHALQAVEEKMPGFWKKRLNQPCFDMSPVIAEEKPQVKTESNNEAEILIAQGQRAAQEQDWKTAVRFYQKAAELNNPDAYYALGEFCEKVFYKHTLYKDEYWEDFNDNENFYYDRALELGDQRAMFRFVEENIDYASNFIMVGVTLSMLKNPFTLFKRRKETKTKASKAIEYMKYLLNEKYQPALLLLSKLQESANSEDGNEYKQIAIDILKQLK